MIFVTMVTLIFYLQFLVLTPVTKILLDRQESGLVLAYPSIREYETQFSSQKSDTKVDSVVFQ